MTSCKFLESKLVIGILSILAKSSRAPHVESQADYSEFGKGLAKFSCTCLQGLSVRGRQPWLRKENMMGSNMSIHIYMVTPRMIYLVVLPAFENLKSTANANRFAAYIYIYI